VDGVRLVPVVLGGAAVAATVALATGVVLTGLEAQELRSEATALTASAGDSERLQEDNVVAVTGLDDAFDDVDRGSFRVRSAQVAAQATAFDAGKIAEDAAPSVVQIACGDVIGSGYVTNGTPADGFGSMVVTSLLVVDACTFGGGPVVEVTQQGEVMASELWSWDEENALALVMIEPERPALYDAYSSAPAGTQVVAIGSALGLESTVTVGVVSNVDDLLVQTDAALNPGSEGGPLLDDNGRVLGINTLGSGGAGIGFAVRARTLCELLLDCDPRLHP
jgi:S1-C subfamily serine protease